MTDLVEQHQNEFHKIAVKIDELIADSPQAKSRFTEYINRFCKMVEDFGQALQRYEISFRKTLEKIRKDPKFRNMPDEYKIFLEARKRCPLPENWIEIPWQDTKFIKMGDYLPTQFIKCNAQLRNTVNPVTWFKLEPQLLTRQRTPKEDEELMCDYVLLGVVHDRMMQTPTQKLFSTLGGKWFDRIGFYDKVCETFCGDIHASLRRDPQSPMTPEERGNLERELREKLSRLNLISARIIKANLAESIPTETEQGIKDTKNEKAEKLRAISKRFLILKDQLNLCDVDRFEIAGQCIAEAFEIGAFNRPEHFALRIDARRRLSQKDWIGGWDDFRLWLKCGKPPFPPSDHITTNYSADFERAAKAILEEAKAIERAERANKQPPKLPPLSIEHRAVLDIIESLPPNTGIQAGKLVERLETEKHINIDESTFRKSVYPALKPYGVKNQRKGSVGYYKSTQ